MIPQNIVFLVEQASDFVQQPRQLPLTTNLNFFATGHFDKPCTIFCHHFYTQSKNVQFNKPSLHKRYHWEHDVHGYHLMILATNDTGAKGYSKVSCGLSLGGNQSRQSHYLNQILNE